MDHVTQAYKQRELEKAFRYYNSEILRSINNNVAKSLGGTEYKKSFKDMLSYKSETRSADEIKNHMLDKFKEIGES